MSWLIALVCPRSEKMDCSKGSGSVNSASPNSAGQGLGRGRLEQEEEKGQGFLVVVSDDVLSFCSSYLMIIITNTTPPLRDTHSSFAPEPQESIRPDWRSKGSIGRALSDARFTRLISFWQIKEIRPLDFRGSTLKLHQIRQHWHVL